jgi:hypothetical protein
MGDGAYWKKLGAQGSFKIAHANAGDKSTSNQLMDFHEALVTGHTRHERT